MAKRVTKVNPEELFKGIIGHDEEIKEEKEIEIPDQKNIEEEKETKEQTEKKKNKSGRKSAIDEPVFPKTFYLTEKQINAIKIQEIIEGKDMSSIARAAFDEYLQDAYNFTLTKKDK